MYLFIRLERYLCRRGGVATPQKNFASSGSSKPITTTIIVDVRIFDKFIQREKIILINAMIGWWGSTMILYHGRLMVYLHRCSSRCSTRISFAIKHPNRVAMDKTSLDIWLHNHLASVHACSCSENTNDALPILTQSMLPSADNKLRHLFFERWC